MKTAWLVTLVALVDMAPRSVGACSKEWPYGYFAIDPAHAEDRSPPSQVVVTAEPEIQYARPVDDNDGFGCQSSADCGPGSSRILVAIEASDDRTAPSWGTSSAW